MQSAYSHLALTRAEDAHEDALSSREALHRFLGCCNIELAIFCDFDYAQAMERTVQEPMILFCDGAIPVTSMCAANHCNIPVPRPNFSHGNGRTRILTCKQFLALAKQTLHPPADSLQQASPEQGQKVPMASPRTVSSALGRFACKPKPEPSSGLDDVSTTPYDIKCA
jgi:hypothetical protein